MGALELQQAEEIMELKAKVESLKAGLEYFVRHGHGSDTTPTVMSPDPGYVWWANYINNADQNVRAYAKAVLRRNNLLEEK